ncbi:MAG: hypothetical protein UR15_C0025G0012 [Parcubacteria group bacterium GW2011_GWA2_31_28]|nr:MAG: hypothetical protein UR15_C0025G0012 [Parcubacteria group bacterium GW2011_GWA2_31_28]
MLNNIHKERKKSINPIAAGVTGAVIGAGAAVAGAVILKDKKNRENIKKVLNKVKDTTSEYMKDMRSSAKDKRDDIKRVLSVGKKK